MLLLLLLLGLRRLLRALTGGSLRTLALPDGALLVGEPWRRVVLDRQLPAADMLPAAAVARLGRLQEVPALRSRFGWGGGCGRRADRELVGRLGLDAVARGRGHRALAHWLDGGGGRGGQ